MRRTVTLYRAASDEDDEEKIEEEMLALMNEGDLNWPSRNSNEEFWDKAISHILETLKTSHGTHKVQTGGNETFSWIRKLFNDKGDGYNLKMVATPEMKIIAYFNAIHDLSELKTSSELRQQYLIELKFVSEHCRKKVKNRPLYGLLPVPEITENVTVVINDNIETMANEVNELLKQYKDPRHSVIKLIWSRANDTEIWNHQIDIANFMIRTKNTHNIPPVFEDSGYYFVTNVTDNETDSSKSYDPGHFELNFSDNFQSVTLEEALKQFSGRRKKNFESLMKRKFLEMNFPRYLEAPNISHIFGKVIQVHRAILKSPPDFQKILKTWDLIEAHREPHYIFDSIAKALSYFHLQHLDRLYQEQLQNICKAFRQTDVERTSMGLVKTSRLTYEATPNYMTDVLKRYLEKGFHLNELIQGHKDETKWTLVAGGQTARERAAKARPLPPNYVPDFTPEIVRKLAQALEVTHQTAENLRVIGAEDLIKYAPKLGETLVSGKDVGLLLAVLRIMSNLAPDTLAKYADKIVTIFENNDEVVRREAVLTLGKLEAPTLERYASHIIGMLEDADSVVRRAAVRSLGILAPKHDTSIVGMLEDSTELVRSAAVDALSIEALNTHASKLDNEKDSIVLWKLGKKIHM